MEIRRLARDAVAEPVSRDQVLRRERGQGNINFPYPADHEQDWQPYPVDPYPALCVTIHNIHRRKVTQDLSNFLLRCLPYYFASEGFSQSFTSSTVTSNFAY